MKRYFPQLWVARCPNLAQPLNLRLFSNRALLETLRPSEVVETALCHASIIIIITIIIIIIIIIIITHYQLFWKL